MVTVHFKDSKTNYQYLTFCVLSCVLQLLQLEDSPYSYNLHMEVVKLLRKQGDLDELRRACERMSAVFPLTEGSVIHILT